MIDVKNDWKAFKQVENTRWNGRFHRLVLTCELGVSGVTPAYAIRKVLDLDCDEEPTIVTIIFSRECNLALELTRAKAHVRENSVKWDYECHTGYSITMWVRPNPVEYCEDYDI